MDSRHYALALLSCVLVIAGCGSRPEPVRAGQVRPPAPAPTPSPLKRTLSAADYVATAGSIDLYEIRASELAATRSNSARVRDFARQMMVSHRGTSAQLSLAGRRLNLLPPATVRQPYRRMLAELAVSPNFDSTYKRQQIAVHQTALELHTAYAARGDSPTLRPVAAAAVPAIRRHLEMARKL